MNVIPGNETARRRQPPPVIGGSCVAVPTWRVEAAWAIGIWSLAFAARAAVQWWLPTIPVSDFRTLLDFATCLAQGQCFSGSWHWDFVNPGVPLLLAPWLHWLPASPEAIARWASVLVSSSIGLLPLLIWRGIVPDWVRRLAGVLLALWPGSILTAGLFSQDNWALLPSVALAALAVRNLTPRHPQGNQRPRLLEQRKTLSGPDPQAVNPDQELRTDPAPVAVLSRVSSAEDSLRPDTIRVNPPPPAPGMALLAVGLWGLAVAIRQEMVLVLFPVAILAGLGWPIRTWQWRQILTAVVAAAAILCSLAVLRQNATGRFAITTRHGGLSLLGATMPGVGLDYWANPWPYLAAVEPAALKDVTTTDEACVRLAWAEVRRRPLFHAARIAGSTLVSLASSDGKGVYWTLGAPDAIPADRRAAASQLCRRAITAMLAENLIFHFLFLVTLALAVVTHDRATFLLAATILLKVAVHAIVVSQGRYFVQVTAIELLAIALATWMVKELRPRRQLLASVIAGLVAMATLATAGSWAHAAFLAGIEDPPRSYTFTIFSDHHEASLTCRMDIGRLANLGPNQATIQPFHRDPAPGETATAICQARRIRASVPLVLRVFDAYPKGALPGRIVQRVRSGGQTLWEHDLAAEPGAGWNNIPIAGASDANVPEVIIEVVAVQPDPGCGWGPAAATSFRLVASTGTAGSQ